MTTRTILRGADVVTPTRVLSDAAVVIEGARILEILGTVPALGGETVCWVSGVIAPGFIDLHSDAFERELRPRPTALVPTDLAFTEFDRKLAGHGITTMFHAVTFAEEDGARFHRESAAVVDAIRALDGLVRHRVHARYEITDLDAAPTVERLLADGDVDLLSFADHTPGERQFKDRAAYVEYYARAYGIGGERMTQVAERKLQRKTAEGDEVRRAVETLAEAARQARVPMASHDDDSAEQVAWAEKLGVSIAEFPVNLEALGAARDAGLHTVMGAPNIVRGRSTGQNLAALAALARRALDSLCSDYFPASLLHAAIKLYRERHCSLPEALALTSRHPARAVGLDRQLGSLEPGKLADLVVIGAHRGVPVVTRTFRDGQEIWRCDYGSAA
jgi:alpha-D-ribose 1-methylphosphonate 5-triphosphate diphosphatase